MDLVVRCYQLTSQFPKTEIYGLSIQIQRAAGFGSWLDFSIP
ncbi:MAG: four helix bundle protein [Trichodesmium sp. St19_bin1]|nr:four helix bundle protein [Trichodesmium sp. St19_bin1]